MKNININANVTNTTLDLATRGITKAEIDTLIQHTWEIYPILQDALKISRYYVRHWQAGYVYSILKSGSVYSIDDNITYHVKYYKCTALEAYKCDTVRLSFRASPYGNYVLIMPNSTPLPMEHI